MEVRKKGKQKKIKNIAKKDAEKPIENIKNKINIKIYYYTDQKEK
jgi:hypothetical protein